MESARNKNLGPSSGSLVIKWSAVVKIFDISSPLKWIWQSTCSSTCHTCPAPRPRCWKLSPRPFVRPSASMSTSIRITNAIHTNGASSLIKIWYIHITNLIFYLYFRDTAAHLAQLIPLYLTLHKDFLGLFTRISLNQLFRICFQSILQLLIFTLPLLISGLGSCGEGEGTWWWLELLLVHKEFCIKGAFLSRIFKVYKFLSKL